MISRSFILGKLMPYARNKKIVVYDQNTNDIIKEILNAHKVHCKDYDNICEYFWKGTERKTAHFIWKFLKNNVKYSIEPDTRQSVKSPSAILATGVFQNGMNDCKHYSQFTAGILDALNRKGKKINWCYRFSNYRYFTKQPQHVFCVINPNTKNEIWIDAVLNYFDEKKPYINKIDKKINMPLYKISGFDNYNNYDVVDAFGQIDIGRVKKRKPKQTFKKASIFKRGLQTVKTGVKKVARGVKKIYGSIPRQSFLGLVKINAFNFAKNLNEAMKNPVKKARLFSKWQKLGGTVKVLVSNINQGVNVYKKKNPSYIGVDVATLVASATPIILALIEFLPKGTKQAVDKQNENLPAETQSEIKQATQQAVQTANSAFTPRSAETGTGTETKQEAETESEEIETETTSTMPKNLLLYAGIGLGAYFLLTRKK